VIVKSRTFEYFYLYISNFLVFPFKYMVYGRRESDNRGRFNFLNISVYDFIDNIEKIGYNDYHD